MKGRQLYYHYSDVVMGSMASQITSLTMFYSTVYSSVDQRKHQSAASLAFVRGIHRWLVNSLHKGPVTRKMFPLMTSSWCWNWDLPGHWLRLVMLVCWYQNIYWSGCNASWMSVSIYFGTYHVPIYWSLGWEGIEGPALGAIIPI